MSSPAIRRCAIYTRKSTEDGLDQAFNSLDAQREACAAYIASQIGLGWKAIEDTFDDGGVSGGTMERPALTRLLALIEQDQVDVVVVYKIDRFTRSLADFARMIELFERHDVAFVSVTQQFSTTSSMGRLTLNVLLSFAQFEREVGAERVRDKVAAARRKGLWMGGTVPFGYKLENKTLIEDEPAASIVRHIFERYLELKSVRLLVRDLKSNRPDGLERPISKGWLYHLLANPVYIGKARHKDQVYEGVHKAILATEVFNEAQAQLAKGPPRGRRTRPGEGPHLLTGLLFDETGDRLTPTHSTKARTKPRYYISSRLSKLRKADTDPNGWRLPAAELEQAAEQELARLLGDQKTLGAALGKDASAENIKAIADAARLRLEAYPQASLAKRKRLLRAAFTNIHVAPGKLTFKIDVLALVSELVSEPGDKKDVEVDEGQPSKELLCIERPFRIRRRGIEAKLIVDAPGSTNRKPDQALIALIKRAHTYLDQLTFVPGQTISEIATRNNVPASEVSRTLPVGFLDPTITKAILAGNQPVDLTVDALLRIPDLPMDWDEQRRMLGFKQVL